MPIYYAVPATWIKFVWGVGIGASVYVVLRLAQGALIERHRAARSGTRAA